ncbi:MAG: type II toxin-antitoxin system Phd/YefM family antitoxin [Ancrocorticia sp.]|uniref:type II toxin-antitoxin system Phd/YefM family antitoxin n=1 Tax=Ancrocorticia sp. TaxID=2593684 RepID=UPI003F8DA119
MSTVSVRDLRNHGGDVLERVARGESIVVTRDGSPAAQLTPLRRPSAPPSELIERRRRLPRVDPESLRHDIDTLLDPTL